LRSPRRISTPQHNREHDMPNSLISPPLSRPDVNENVLDWNIFLALQKLISLSTGNPMVTKLYNIPRPNVNENVLDWNIFLAIQSLVSTGGFTPAAFIAYLATLPTADPHVVNAPWNNGGILTISAG
jgi:hypothetical protein